MYCGAKTKTGDPCRTPAMPNGRCRRHGGLTPPPGITHPNTVTGRYSKHLPTRHLARYAESRSDPDIVALRDEIALTDARLADLLARVDHGEAGATWNALAKAMAAHDRAEDDAERAYHLSRLREIIRRGLGDYAAWEEVHRMVEQRRRLSETEVKRVNQDNAVITADRAMLLIGTILGIVRECVNDRDGMALASRRIGSILVDAGRPAPGPGGGGGGDILVPAEVEPPAGAADPGP